MFSSVLLSLLSIPLVAALPATPFYKEHATHYTRSLSNGSKIKTYHPRSRFETYGSGLQRRGISSTIDPSDYRTTSLQFVHSKLGEEADLEIVSEYQGPHSTHVWVSQKINGIPVINTLANVAVNSRGEVVSYSSSFVSTKKGNSLVGGGTYKTTPKLSPEEASVAAVASLGGQTPSSHKPTLQFLVVESGDIKLVHSVRMLLEDGHSVQAHVDAEDGKVHGIIDYTADLAVQAIPFQKADIRDGTVLLENVEDATASPKGWTFQPGGEIPAGITAGNNVLAAVIGDVSKIMNLTDFAQFATEFTDADTLDYPYSLEDAPDSAGNRNAAVVNMFYVANMAHDVLYRYGFTEKAFNFQMEDFVEGGKAGDAVAISVQDSTGKNNAQFSTFPDGEPSLMQTFLFNWTDPERDSSMDVGVVLHEMAHGLTNRMTGGGTAACLQSTEARGLGEGWSDSFADWVSQTSSTHMHDFIVGGFLDSPNGFRSHPYSIFRATNPLTYADLKDRQEVHAIGEVWAQTLHNVLANLVREFDGSTDALTNPDGDNGHAVFMRLFVDSLAIQPCNPSFTDARDAFIQADANRYDGKHSCALWQGFAYLGLGMDAKDFTNSIRMPEGCEIPPHLRAEFAALVG